MQDDRVKVQRGEADLEDDETCRFQRGSSEAGIKARQRHARTLSQQA